MPVRISTVNDANAETVTEICRRLDGMPLAIELAAARVRALSLNEILDSLHDRFKLLTGGARTAVRRQQTLRASVDWSHALLTEPERVLFRRLAVFMGGIRPRRSTSRRWSTTEVERFRCSTNSACSSTNHSLSPRMPAAQRGIDLLETVRQYTLEKLGESGEAERGSFAAPRPLHRDGHPVGHTVTRANGQRLVEQAEIGDRQSARGVHMES